MSQHLLDAVVLGSIYTLFALGLTLSWGVLNVLNLAHGAIFLSGGLVAYTITKDSALPLWVVLPVAMIVAGLIAVALEVVAYRPLRARVGDIHAAELPMLIASVGAAFMLTGIGTRITGNPPVGIRDDVFHVTSHDIGGLRVTNLEVLIIVVALALGIGLAIFVRRSRHGRALRALAHDPYTCGLLGISPERMAIATMFVSGALAGTAGVLLTMQQSAIEAHSWEPLLLKGFAVIVLGGVGSVWGAILAAYVLALAEIGTVVYVSGSLRDGVAFALILLLLLFRPQGLFTRTAWQRA
jgi:branched-chain amino acid transport system permease protein